MIFMENQKGEKENDVEKRKYDRRWKQCMLLYVLHSSEYKKENGFQLNNLS